MQTVENGGKWWKMVVTVSLRGPWYTLYGASCCPRVRANTQGCSHRSASQKHRILIYGTILRKNEPTGSEIRDFNPGNSAELASEFFAGFGSTSTQESSQDLVQGIQRGFIACPQSRWCPPPKSPPCDDHVAPGLIVTFV